MTWKMNIRLSDAQVEQILRSITKEQFIDFLEKDVGKSVDWICEFIKKNVDKGEYQERIRKSFPFIQLELWK